MGNVLRVANVVLDFLREIVFKAFLLLLAFRKALISAILALVKLQILNEINHFRSYVLFYKLFATGFIGTSETI